MVRKLTRQLFIDHECRGRGRAKAVKEQILQEWRRKNKQHKIALVRMLNNVLDCQDVVQASKPLVAAAFTWASGRANQPDTAADFHFAHEEAIEIHQELIQARRRLQQAYERLATMHHRQRGSRESIDYANRLKNAEDGKIALLETTIDALEQAMDTQQVTVHPAGVAKMPRAWLSKGARERHQGGATTARARRRLGHNLGNVGGAGRWYSWSDRGGGLSRAWLWIKFDGADNAVDRVLRKEVTFNDQRWFDAREWAGTANDEANREPLELHCHGDIEAVTNKAVANRVPLTPANKTVLVDRTLRCFKMYLTWCGNGDLDDVVKDYRHARQPIPEPFIWSVAETLAEVTLAMELGHINTANAVAVPAWREIVHRDIKPGNIFLTAADPTHFPTYPQTLLGDWGLAIRTSAQDGGNPHWYQNVGTEGFLAPEQVGYVDQTTLAPLGDQLLAHTNIWAVGIILHTLMTNTPEPDQPAYFGNPAIDYNNHYTNHAYPGYSDEIVGMMRNCLHWNPTLRRTPAQLSRYIRNVLADPVVGPLAHGDVMKNPVAPADADAQRLVFEADWYLMGLARGNMPA